jgi:hypothetical protein
MSPDREGGSECPRRGLRAREWAVTALFVTAAAATFVIPERWAVAIMILAPGLIGVPVVQYLRVLRQRETRDDPDSEEGEAE